MSANQLPNVGKPQQALPLMPHAVKHQEQEGCFEAQGRDLARSQSDRAAARERAIVTRREGMTLREQAPMNVDLPPAICAGKPQLRVASQEARARRGRERKLRRVPVLFEVGPAAVSSEGAMRESRSPNVRKPRFP